MCKENIEKIEANTSYLDSYNVCNESISANNDVQNST
jgi:hypothetical protein